MTNKFRRYLSRIWNVFCSTPLYEEFAAGRIVVPTFTLEVKGKLKYSEIAVRRFDIMNRAKNKDVE